MNKVCTIFEDWLIEDGSYPELHKGQRINVKFSLDVYDKFKKVKKLNESYLKQKNYSEYTFGGKILSNKNYISIEEVKLVMRLNTGRNKKILEEGNFIEGVGNLNVDIMSELSEYEAVIEKIYKVYIPEKFISRSKNGLSSPCSLKPEYYAKENVKLVDLIPNNLYNTDSPLNTEVVFHLLELRLI